MKKVFSLFCISIFCLILMGCGNSEKNNKESQNSGIQNEGSQNEGSLNGRSLNDIMDKLYEGVIEKNGSTDFERVELTSENFEDYTAIRNVRYKEALVSEDATGFITHSVILIRLENVKDVANVVADLKKTHNPEDWVCGAPKYIEVLSKGDLVILIIGNDPVLKIKENFENLK